MDIIDFGQMNNHSLSPPSKVKEISRLTVQAAFPCTIYGKVKITVQNSGFLSNFMETNHR